MTACSKNVQNEDYHGSEKERRKSHMARKFHGRTAVTLLVSYVLAPAQRCPSLRLFSNYLRLETEALTQHEQPH